MAEESYILYYSDYCEYCLTLLKEIHDSGLDEIFTNFNVDQNRSSLPEYVQEVPCVFIKQYNHLLTGEEVFGLINHMKKELGINEQQQMNPSQKQQMNPPQQQQMKPTQQQQQMHPSRRQQQMHPSQQQTHPSQEVKEDDNELEPYSICEMGGCSDNYSYIEDSKIIQHNYELINNDENIIVKNQNIDNRPQNSNYDNNKKKIPDDQLQKLISERRNDMPKPIDRT